MTQAFVSPERLNAALMPAIRAALADAISRCCAVRGDTDENRAALIEECAALSIEHQRDLIEHFNDQTRLFTTAGITGSAAVNAAQPSAAGRAAAGHPGDAQGAMPPAVPQPADHRAEV